MKHFRPEEFECKCGCGKALMDADFLSKLEDFRRDMAFPFILTSAYRCEDHNRAIGGAPKSAHMEGKAVDIQVNGIRALTMVSEAIVYGFNGVGVNQKGKGRFIHLDTNHPEYNIWSY